MNTKEQTGFRTPEEIEIIFNEMENAGARIINPGESFSKEYLTEVFQARMDQHQEIANGQNKDMTILALQNQIELMYFANLLNLTIK